MKYEFDIAFSFADEDSHIVEKLNAFLTVPKEKRYYYKYTAHQIKEVGQLISNIIEKNYSGKARVVLIVVSENYLRKKTTIDELVIILRAYYKSRQEKSIILLQIDDTKLPGLPQDMIYLSWDKNSPEYVAHVVDKKIDLLKRRVRTKNLFFIYLPIILILLIGFFLRYSFFTVDSSDNLSDTTVVNGQLLDTLSRGSQKKLKPPIHPVSREIAGTVFDKETNQPIQNAKVIGEFESQTQTNKNGRFTLKIPEDIDKDRIRIEIQHPIDSMRSFSQTYLIDKKYIQIKL